MIIVVDVTDVLWPILQDITSKWAEVRKLVPQRDGTLQQELAKQQNNEMMRRQFAEKANAVGPWIERQMDAVASIAMGMQVRHFLLNWIWHVHSELPGGS